MPRTAKPAHERVLARTTHTPDGCWLFTGALNHGGYGIIQLGRGIGTDRAHRVVYAALVAPIPAGMTLDHLCAHTACVNPDHLEIVTRAENAQRQWADGRADPGRGNRAKTHCPHGHAYDDANTHIYRGRRVCRTCKRLEGRARRASARNVEEVVNQAHRPDPPVDSVAA